jgi:hypothetical protein
LARLYDLQLLTELSSQVTEGQLRIGTPICVPTKEFLELGRIGSIEIDKKPAQVRQTPCRPRSWASFSLL